DDQPLAAPLDGPAVLSRMSIPLDRRDHEVQGTGPLSSRHLFAQPRAVAYRERTDTLLVVSEGRDAVVELDALAIDPSASRYSSYELSPWDSHTVDLPAASDTDCGAPSGLALSEDESRAYVFCRSTATLAEVQLVLPVPSESVTGARRFAWRSDVRPSVTLHDVADDPLDDEAAFGRRLFYDGRDTTMSFGMACAACHPDGRDDGHVWHEVPDTLGAIYRAFPDRDARLDVHRRGEPRQTPMLAGRVSSAGPYGWRGKDASLLHRVLHGFGLHHTWGAPWIGSFDRERAAALVAFLRGGLVPPPEPTAPLTAEQQRGQEIFDDPMTGCATCHVDDGGEHTDRSIHELDLRGAPGFLGEEPPRLRTPSLRFLAGTAPYLHDGSVASLDQLIAGNHDRMGRTTRLAEADKRALVAFLKSLGGGQAPDETLPSVLPELPERSAEVALASAPPSEAAWAHASPMVVDRAPDTCEVFRLDDWVRVRCAHHVTEIAQFGGATEGVTLTHSEPYIRRTTRARPHPERVDDAILTFPIRPGDRRQFQLLHGRPVRWSGVILTTELVVSELWREGDPDPSIVIH
ncbi:MAG: c-type cytochrome, partial [Polyangiaceae bacterium]